MTEPCPCLRQPALAASGAQNDGRPGILGRGRLMRRHTLIGLVFAVALGTPGLAREQAGRARIDGQVTDGSGAPLSGATVSLRTPEGKAGPEVTSDTGGRFIFDRVAAGAWVLEVTAPDHRAERVGVHLPHESSWLGPVGVRLSREGSEPRTEAPAASVAPESPADTPPATEEPERGTLAVAPAPAGDPEVSASYSAVQLALASGRSDLARELAATVSPTDAGSADIFFQIGREFLLAGETTLAVAFFGRALERETEHVQARYERALGLLALGRLGEARKDLEAVCQLQPDGPLGAKAGRALEELAPATEPGG